MHILIYVLHESILYSCEKILFFYIIFTIIYIEQTSGWGGGGGLGPAVRSGFSKYHYLREEKKNSSGQQHPIYLFFIHSSIYLLHVFINLSPKEWLESPFFI